MAGEVRFTGEKYDQLVAIAPEVESAGMFMAGMSPIDQEMIDGELRANSMATIEDADIFKNGIDMERFKLSPDMTDHLITEAERLAQEFGGGPVILRSSSRGDSVGNGVYESKRFEPSPEGVNEAFKIVVGSYFAEPGRIFRERAGLQPGFAAFIQPLVGNMLNGRYNDLYGSSNKFPATTKLFRTPFSGNARLNTPLHPTGAIKIQSGLGSAVNIDQLVAIDFGIDRVDDYEPDHAMHNLLRHRISVRALQKFYRDTGRDHYVYLNEAWDHDYCDDYLPVYGYIQEEYGEKRLTFGGLKEVLIRLNKRLGSNPTYYEFAARYSREGDEIYIVQKGDISVDESSPGLESVDKRLVMVSEAEVEAGNGACPKFDTIVCLTDNNKIDLYKFDKSPEATGGYLLAYHARSSGTLNKIDSRRLKNARAFMTFESHDWSHSAQPEDHIAGYSDQLGIPLLSGKSGGDAWTALTGWRREDDEPTGQHIGNLVVRHGNFQVITEAVSREALILDLDR